MSLAMACKNFNYNSKKASFMMSADKNEPTVKGFKSVEDNRPESTSDSVESNTWKKLELNDPFEDITFNPRSLKNLKNKQY
jgi:hypothetical protein